MRPNLPPISENKLLLLLCAVQFVHVVDYMMVLPLGPDFAAALGFPIHSVGYIAGAYALAAGVAGLLCAFYLDTYTRKNAMLFCLGGVSLTTLATALVDDVNTMIAARLAAGAFGGPMMGLCNAFIADYIPPERRGRAMGKLMSVYAIASVLALPLALEMALYTSWRGPFVAVGLLGLAVMLLGYISLPLYPPFVAAGQSLRQRGRAIAKLLRDRWVLSSYATMATGMVAAHIAIPAISPHVQMNQGVPREDMGLLYMAAGGISLFTMHWAGRLVDKHSSTYGALFFGGLFVINIFIWFIWVTPLIPAIIPFALFMVALSGRGISVQALSSKVPSAESRGAYMAMQSSIIQFAGAFASYLAATIMYEKDGALMGTATIGWVSILLSCFVPVMVWRIEQHVRRRKQAVEIATAPMI